MSSGQQIPPWLQEQLMKMQQAQQSLQSIHLQKQQLEMEQIEANKALEELKKASDDNTVYKHAGSILIKSNKTDLIAELEETKELAKTRSIVLSKLKVSFANEIGNVCKQLGIDGHRIMEIFCQDTKLNLSPYYLKPGFAFGGSCLPKDLRALTYKARNLDLDLPVLNAIVLSNERQLERGIRMVLDKGNNKVGILGFSFKAGTDDLRESPMVEVIERLIGKGYDLKIYDQNVKLASLVGANRDYILNRIPHISKLMVDNVEDVLSFADTVVIGNGAEEFRTVLTKLRPGQVVVDLVRIIDTRSEPGRYDGICW